MKAIARRVVNDDENVLQVSTKTGLPIEFLIRKCEWEVPGLKIYDQDHARSILKLTERSCESEWLVDTVNIYIQNQNTESITGVLNFDTVKGFTYKTAPAESFPELNTVLPVAPLNVRANSKFSSLDSWSIAISVLFAICIAVKIVCYFGYKFYIKLFKHGSYDVWKRSHQYSEELIDC
ncbi:hypothetical protein CAEBREN_20362 [Caenorhabditis brenneri]|uniref:Uncharacterized protein n=1 Tax=Caenorhabditis brenneri TaxID=135651 RepID=G0MSC0_CAEBE|nr:hypothetical protein CAEBREN_20362 [Caenorhabditis brenneri]